jgi:glycosyltransferase involved in cell wall biosynthesis
MRIALFHNLPSGGAKRAVFEWTKRLGKEHTIDAYSLETANHTFCDIRPFVSQHKIFNHSVRRLFKSPFGRLNQLQRLRDLNDLEHLNREIAKQINAGRYDILFAHTCMYTFIPILLQYVEVPSVYYLHEPFGPGFVRPLERPYILKKRWRYLLDRIDPFISLYEHRLVALQKQSIHKTDLLLSNSQFTSDCIKNTFGADSVFCPIGVDVEIFYPLPNISRENFVLSVGELSPRKGFDFVIESLGRIPKEKRPSLKLACNVVQENELRFVRDLARRSNVDVEVLTKVGTDELRLLYNQARLCVYAPVKEPFGLVLLEAMACGTPVIGVRDGGIQESVIHGYTGLLIERDPEQFGNAIQTLMGNPQLAASYGCNGREHVTKNWIWEKSAAMLNTYFAERAGLAA